MAMSSPTTTASVVVHLRPYAVAPPASAAPRSRSSGSRRPAVHNQTLDTSGASGSTAVATSSSSACRPSPETGSLFRSLAKRSAIADVKSSDDLDSALIRVDGVLQVHDYNILLRYFGESKRWKEVSQLFDWMQRHERLNFASYSSFFKYMGLSRNPVKALGIYDDIADKATKIDVSVCNSLLGCLIANGRSDSSIKFFYQMKDDGLMPDLVTYSTLLAGCNKMNEGYSKAMKLVMELEHLGFNMDTVLYGALLSVCAKSGCCEEAEMYFQRMKDEGYSPNVFHYSSLLNAYSTDGNYVKAEKLVNEMKSSGLVPNKVILTTLLKVYAKGHLFEKSENLLSELEALGYAEDEIPYCIFMDNLAKAGNLQEAKKIFLRMKEKDVKSGEFTLRCHRTL